MLIGILIGIALVVLLQRGTNLLDQVTQPRYLIIFALVAIIFIIFFAIGPVDFQSFTS
jgi:hypothetical protein